MTLTKINASPSYINIHKILQKGNTKIKRKSPLVKAAKIDTNKLTLFFERVTTGGLIDAARPP